MSGNNKILHMVTFLLVIVGGLNWLLVGLLQWDLVAAIFGGMAATLSRVIYVLVGLSAIVQIFTHKGDCKTCSMSSSSGMGAQKMGM